MLRPLALRRAGCKSPKDRLVAQHEAGQQVEGEHQGQCDEDVDAHGRALVDHDERCCVEAAGERQQAEVDEKHSPENPEVVFHVGRVLDSEHDLQVEEHRHGVDQGATNLRSQHAPDGSVVVRQPAEARSGVVVSGNSGGQTHHQGRNSESCSGVEGHPAVVDVSEFGQHSVDVDGVDHDPGEHGHTEVVEAHGDEGTQEGQLGQLGVDQDKHQDKNLKLISSKN